MNILTNNAHFLAQRPPLCTGSFQRGIGAIQWRYLQEVPPDVMARSRKSKPAAGMTFKKPNETVSFHWNQGTAPSHHGCQVQSSGLGEGHTMNQMPFTQCHEDTTKLSPLPEHHLGNKGRENS